MKKISKKLLDTHIEAIRNYWFHESSQEILSQINRTSQDIEAATRINFIAIWDFIGSIIKPGGLCTNAENDEIYCALRVLGWEVVDNASD